ncbi:WHI2-like protein P4H10.16c [Daldinia childiae]|uniref:WHI2-like protein P4H10.16c n=1 Tax=Daldinia childiae TaxID=326645 RepID=UPI0014456EEF|nr:WHI2-like protein P4H10.16c [Daldinia childiae]KAF3068433.1 WHI2-like protein P4H10.16c [Daldinia childiae]
MENKSKLFQWTYYLPTLAYTAKLSELQEESHGQSVSAGLPPTNIDEDEGNLRFENDEVDNLDNLSRGRSPPPQYPYPTSEASASTSFSLAASRPAPPPFSSLYTVDDHFKLAPTTCGPTSEAGASSATAAPAYAPSDSAFDSPLERSSSFNDTVAETKRALPQDVKGESSQKVDDPNEPPPAYSEGYSPLLSFTYLMAAAGGASSIITQVQQGGPPVNSIGDVGVDETITMDLRGTRFILSRDELLTLPEFVLLSLFPNGLFPEGHMGGFSEGDAVQVDVSTLNDKPPTNFTQITSNITCEASTVPLNACLPASTLRNLVSNINIHITDLISQYDPASLQYMLDFFRNVAQSIPNEASPTASPEGGAVPIDSLGGRGDDGSKRAGIIVLREDLDFYAIPPRPDINQAEMIEVKRAAARALLKQDGIFSGLKRSDEPGTTEAHLIEMLTAGGFNHDDRWGHRAGEPNKAVVCSLALARLRSDIRGNDMGNNAVGMAQKLLLFWRKPARRCWWEGVDLQDVEGVEGTLKVWIRRVWTLEMSVIGLR